jgi:hypothetical protein
MHGGGRLFHLPQRLINICVRQSGSCQGGGYTPGSHQIVI